MISSSPTLAAPSRTSVVNMIRHRSTVLLAASLAYLGWILGSSVRFHLNSAIANSSVTSSSVAVAQASPPATQQTPLKLGDRGAPVITLQSKLKQLGYYKGLADGTYSETTKQAVSDFQKSVGLSVTGVLDEATWNRMQKAKGSKSKSSKSKPKGFLQGNKKKLLLILGSSATLAIAGGGVFLLQKQLKRKKTLVPPNDPIPNTEDKFPTETFSTETFSTESSETESDQTVDLESHTNGHTSSYKNENVSVNDNFPVEKTTRLSKINIIDELIKDLRTPD
ncbi:MAG TPA: peptidoglycan-binding domain-containing protein, partial [Cyanophyceae cyanobacterium]